MDFHRTADGVSQVLCQSTFPRSHFADDHHLFTLNRGKLNNIALYPNTLGLKPKILTCVGWVEERNPTFFVVCWVTRMFNPTYNYP
ncbi:hypothetical protein [Nostoc sp.]|uniref:hypothetical protein n=1 Tax=Nostoc sp. TaxID=1180 RepID=UPI002FF84D71